MKRLHSWVEGYCDLLVMSAMDRTEIGRLLGKIQEQEGEEVIRVGSEVRLE